MRPDDRVEQAEATEAEPMEVEGTGEQPVPDPAAEAAVVEHDLEDLLARAAQRDEYLALAQRAQADFENYRKRVTREAGAAEDRGIGKVVRELIPALDNLERAIAAAEAEEADSEQHLTKGIRLVQQELVAALERIGIEAFSPKGERFDPTEHEAMAQQPVEGAEPGTVVEVYQQGYRLSGAVIRPARVVVAA